MFETGLGRESRHRKGDGALERPVAIEGPQEKHQVLRVQKKGDRGELQRLKGLQQYMYSTL